MSALQILQLAIGTSISFTLKMSLDYSTTFNLNPYVGLPNGVDVSKILGGQTKILGVKGGKK